MRRNHIAGILVISVFSWLVIIYLLVLDRQNHKFGLLSSPESNDRLRELELKIKEEFKANANLINRFRKAIQLQIEDREAEEEERAESEDQDYKEKEERLQVLGSNPDSIVVLVFACNRVTVSRCIDQLLRFRPNPDNFPIVVSQDCQHEATSNAIKAYGDLVYHIKQPDQNEIPVPPKEKKFKGYFKIARHYGWAMNEIFFHYNFSTAIIIEDDLDVSPDLFSYFVATLPILTRDPSLWCVSAWNDNGKPELVDRSSSALLHRTDFFPGLGWMLTRSTWSELSPKWPASYWDDWIRQPEQRKGRACIRPELSRTRTFGKIGVSNGLFYEKHLKYIYLNDKYVEFTNLNLTYLLKQHKKMVQHFEVNIFLKLLLQRFKEIHDWTDKRKLWPPSVIVTWLL